MITNEEARAIRDKLSEYCRYHTEHDKCEECEFSYPIEYKGKQSKGCELVD